MAGAGAQTTMSHNTFGHLFRVTTFGESHGPAIGCVVDGCPPRIPLTEADIQPYLDKRRPGTVALHDPAPGAGRGQDPLRRVRRRGARHAGDHRHADRAADRQCRPALEGLFATSRTSIGPATPTTPMTSNTACATIAAAAGHRRAKPRRGSPPARSRARSCRACACAARWSRSGRTQIDRAPLGLGRGRAQSVLLPRRQGGRTVRRLSRRRAQERLVDRRGDRGGRRGRAGRARRAGLRQARRRSRRGADGHQRRQGRRDRRRLRAPPSSPARRTPTRCACGNDGKPRFLSNQAGGILGGISTGQPIVARFAVKPTSSILTPRATVDRYGAETEITTKGRHDPCVGIRAVPIGEAMVACVLADHYLRHRGQVGEARHGRSPKPGA